jgi:tetratricopeptide (TPR) repeat protein
MVTVLAIVVVSVAFVALLLRALLRYWRRWFRGVVAADLAAYRRGDYEAQLRAIEPLKVWKPEAYFGFRGGALLELGRLQEAEACFRRSLAMRKNRLSRAIGESQLGDVLLEQQRYAEAIGCFERAIAEWPQRGGGHREIAQTLLRQGVQPAEALRRARMAADIDEGNTTLGAEVRNLCVGASLATLAWAEAVNGGNAAKVEHWLEKAFPLCPETCVPVRAKVHHHAGRAYAALGKADESAREFERAASLDPKGNYGRLAKAAMP